MIDLAGHKDLIVLVADADTEFAIRGILSRSAALGIRSVSYDPRRHVGRDPGCRSKAADFLRSFANLYAHAIVIFDREGSGSNAPRDEIEREVERKLEVSGWGNRAAVVVIDPEIESWVWARSPHVEHVLGWYQNSPELNVWLVQKGFLRTQSIKPHRPKEAMLAVLQETGTPRSASLFAKLAESVTLTKCEDPAFLKLRSTLVRWFPR